MSIMMPGEAAVLTLNDKFFYLSLAMLVTALVAASQWDALAIDSARRRRSSSRCRSVRRHSDSRN